MCYNCMCFSLSPSLMVPYLSITWESLSNAVIQGHSEMVHKNILTSCYTQALHNHIVSNLSSSEASMAPISLTNSLYFRCLMAANLSSKREFCATLISTATAECHTPYTQYTTRYAHVSAHNRYSKSIRKLHHHTI